MAAKTDNHDPENIGLISEQRIPHKVRDAAPRNVRRRIPTVGKFRKRQRLLRNSNNLRFKGVYKPINPTVFFIFISMVLILYYFLHHYVPSLKI